MNIVTITLCYCTIIDLEKVQLFFGLMTPFTLSNCNLTTQDYYLSTIASFASNSACMKYSRLAAVLIVSN